MEYLIAFLIVFVALLIYALDVTYSSFFFSNETVQVNGYFLINRKKVLKTDIEGYGFEEKVIPGQGRYEQLFLKTYSGDKISIIRKAYIDYSEIQSYVENRFPYLGKEQLKNGRLMALGSNLSWYLAALFALIVAILKFL